MRAFPVAAAIAAIAAIAAASGAHAARTAIRDVTAEPTGCSIAVRFGSYAMGIDGGAAARIGDAIARARGVKAISRHRWGREGEYTLCVRTRTARDAAALFKKLRPLLPPRPRGPIAIMLADGRTIEAPAR